MRQVPHYLLIGNGRLACHLRHYLTLLGLSFSSWSRQQKLQELTVQINDVTHILLAISDKAIINFIDEHLTNTASQIIHFSGSLVTDKAFGAHPLMTFSDQLYNLEKYQQIPFILDSDAPTFAELLPGLPNQHFILDKHLKPKYHALCVLSGNFSCLLWQKLFTDLHQELNIPSSAAYPYLQQQTQNLLDDFATALTGPLTRDDQLTINSNLKSLTNDPFQAVYETFISCYQAMKNSDQI